LAFALPVFREKKTASYDRRRTKKECLFSQKNPKYMKTGTLDYAASHPIAFVREVICVGHLRTARLILKESMDIISLLLRY
jgi:hypothetical protein